MVRIVHVDVNSVRGSVDVSELYGWAIETETRNEEEIKRRQERKEKRRKKPKNKTRKPLN